jgi:hypothetical protein
MFKDNGIFHGYLHCAAPSRGRTRNTKVNPNHPTSLPQGGSPTLHAFPALPLESQGI